MYYLPEERLNIGRRVCSGNLKVDTYKLKSIHSKVEMYTDVSST